MTSSSIIPSAPALARRLVCSRCGTEFGCDLSGNCWCAEETAKLPMPLEGEDCLCRECLRKAAAQAAS
ncbi:MAG TPA: cysteine-rich CWC family protein [Bradyrhizobium sp.]|nr:cysteine-rich CWC family protein [Bradyrhizobium sp.]